MKPNDENAGFEREEMNITLQFADENGRGLEVDGQGTNFPLANAVPLPGVGESVFVFNEAFLVLKREFSYSRGTCYVRIDCQPLPQKKAQ